MSVSTLENITAKTITTSRLTTRVLFSGPDGGTPVLFLHGNITNATWNEGLMVSLPPGFRGIAPDQRGYGEAKVDKKVDARRGLGDLADDAIALLDHLDIAQAHIVGISMGGSVIWKLLANYPDRFLSATLSAPGSPYGFGGTKDIEGTPCYSDYAGSGAGLINPEFVKLLAAGDSSTNSPFSPRNGLRTLVFLPGSIPDREEDLLSGTLATHIGEQDYPGDLAPSPNWPNFAPGVWGVNNALSPKYSGPVSELYDADPKIDILWVRGSHDIAVSDNAASDLGTLGAAGYVPGWPGPEVFPPQPMISQTRAVLERYEASGGSFREEVIENAAHVAYLDQPEAFNQLLHQHLKK